MPGKSEVEVVHQVVLAQFPAQRASDVKAGPIRDRQRRKWWRFHRHVGCKSTRAGERGDGSYGNREFLHEKPLDCGHFNEQPCRTCYRPATVNKNSTGQDRASRARGGKRHSFSPVAPDPLDYATIADGIFSSVYIAHSKHAQQFDVSSPFSVSTPPAFRHFRIEPLPHFIAHICGRCARRMVQWRSQFTST